MKNQNDQKLFYKYRSMNALLDGFNELEEEYIYFSPAKDLNDPLEGYLDIDFKGDEILWTNFFKNYIFSLYDFWIFVQMMGKSTELTEEYVHTYFDQDLKEKLSKEGSVYQIASDEIISSKWVSCIIKNWSKRASPVSKQEIHLVLRYLHFYILCIFFKEEVKQGFRKNKPNGFEERLHNDYLVLNNLNKILDVIKDAEEEWNIIFQYTNRIFLNLEYTCKICRLNSDIPRSNIILLINYPKLYLDKLDELMCSCPYVSCFSETYKDLSMWGYYSDSSKGCCLIFKSIKENSRYYLPIYESISFNSGSSNELVTKNFENKELHPVIYSKKKNSIPFFRSLGRLNMIMLKKHWFCYEGKISPIVEDIMNSSKIDKWRQQFWKRIIKNTNTKHKAWSHEQEFRISLIPILDNQYDTVEKRKLKYRFEDLDGIIFGINAKESDKLKIIEIISDKCKKYNRKEFNLYQAFYDNQKGEIDLIPIDIFNREKNI